ncbi:glycosyltransferase [Halorientalis marina]|uniref:glycosyltransferase n=1 Tax=Halorientalis marina TaxID=2931976 RepID=UPI001FF4ABBB|nr:glycosyltransferase [Halorientalis marina]
MANACLVWAPIETTNEAALELPLQIADAINGPIYTQSCPEKLLSEEYNGVRFNEFGRKSLLDLIINKTPLEEINKNAQYATWKPPKQYNTFVTRGPKPIHTVQRIGQRHIHYFEGSYRGFFFHKDKYEEFLEYSNLKQVCIAPIRHYFRTAIQGSVRTVDTVVVNSEWTGELVQSLYNIEVDEIIYPIMTLDTYDPSFQTKASDDYYLYMGKIDALHRIEEVVRAFKQLPYHLKIAGDGKQKEELESEGYDSIEFTGYVTGDEKRELLANANALINPADHSFGRVIVESLASGTPVISANIGYPPHIITEGENGLLYEPGVDNLINRVEDFEREGVHATQSELRKAVKPYKKHRNKAKWADLVGTSAAE